MTEIELSKLLEQFKNDILEAVKVEIHQNNKKILSLKEAAEYLGVSHNTLQKFRYQGLKVFEIDNTKRITKEELNKFIEKYSYEIGR